MYRKGTRRSRLSIGQASPSPFYLLRALAACTRRLSVGKIKMRANFTTYFQKYLRTLFLIGILLFALLYSFPTLTTKPAYWYDEAMNVEIARNFAEFGALDLIVAPNT